MAARPQEACAQSKKKCSLLHSKKKEDGTKERYQKLSKVELMPDTVDEVFSGHLYKTLLQSEQFQRAEQSSAVFLSTKCS